MSISRMALQSGASTSPLSGNRLLLRSNPDYLFQQRRIFPAHCSSSSSSTPAPADDQNHQNSSGIARVRTLSQRRRELPWQTRPDEGAAGNFNGNLGFGAPSPQRTPWDQSTPTPLANKSNRFPRPKPDAGNGSSHSHMLNIVEKLRAIERKQRSYSTHVVPPDTTAAPFSESSSLEGRDSTSQQGSFPWQRESSSEAPTPVTRPQPPKLPCLAELTIPELELRRLQRIAIRVVNPIKVGYLGVTKAVVQDIHRRWQKCEVVKIQCDGPAAINMKQTPKNWWLSSMENWRNGHLYRGKGYFARVDNSMVANLKKYQRRKINLMEAIKIRDEDEDRDYSQSEHGEARRDSEKGNIEDEYLDEIDALLEELGPRYDDWIGRKPVPVDGDLLPASVPGYKPPLRMLPYRAKKNLSNMELTVLRRLVKPLPPHFVLGRNRGLQGLASAILKLWQKSELVKIGLKRGVQNTRNQLMAEELERLTGGVLLSRDKFFITLYRGKDFLPTSVAAVLRERESNMRELLLKEDQVRIPAQIGDGQNRTTPVSGSLSESMEMRRQWEAQRSEKDDEMDRNSAVVALKVREQKRLEAKLAAAISKKRRADLQIVKLERSLLLSEHPRDRETITEEERYMFKKLGLRMDAFLLIGRRGVFDGVIENMHLHWKHRELVKLILKEKDKAIALEVAKMLEIESGGILVGVVTTSKGQAIIVYRGKNYQRPAELRPRSLLTKRKALARSKEINERSNALPDTPHSALYKAIDSKYQEDDIDGELLADRKKLHHDDDDEMAYSDDLLDSEISSDGSESEAERFRPPEEAGDDEQEEESEWDLESEEDEDD
ncbi:CRM-domain containing factor CFM3, chloroplastic/mitochondrial [Selaginella moellendorffii]|uniref:CRM-domain containing factor CFM3, chloroplastic/mitochondrial n=1 Tax=Selaginella moellendorffii TaxID=88036 RepID=UPI000D1C6138|nr:CRM-domain containing factor CFM3, chloroplastic/mitochondrial [Selaginella moellendorffii]|eukprot:XP_024533219.1 CRM-domain containing factor CFM3, chloroplastic/mitochondrial [Selaginella moellendorffii]